VKLAAFDFHLPQELIAQTPVEPRDASRLMVLPKGGGALEHRSFRDLPAYLRPGDVLVVNETKVMPARLVGEREGGGAAEVLLLKRLDRDRWETLVKPGRRLRRGALVRFGGGQLEARMLEETEVGGRIVEFACAGTFEEVLDRLGQMPLPPYITARLEDPSRYQTVYAREWGSAAAPTAGLHFTPRLIAELEGMGVFFLKILLHVGLGTFRPVQVEEIEQHKMHAEYFRVEPETAARINAARAAGGRLIGVGTTSVRTLETVADEAGQIRPGDGWTAIFIYPGYRYRAVDGIITNFHLPKSTLIMMIAAFLGRERLLAAYEEAVRERYRFFSFGDAMLIL
jgi:S-adenosylmethionine:tRNA ribosyltransferase-isomerase